MWSFWKSCQVLGVEEKRHHLPWGGSCSLCEVSIRLLTLSKCKTFKIYACYIVFFCLFVFLVLYCILSDYNCEKKPCTVFFLKNYSLVAGELCASPPPLWSDVKWKWIQTTTSLTSRGRVCGGSTIPFSICCDVTGDPTPIDIWFITALKIVLNSHGVDRSRTSLKLEELGTTCQYNCFHGAGSALLSEAHWLLMLLFISQRWTQRSYGLVHLSNFEIFSL